MSTHLNQSTRSTVELIAELERESQNFDAVGIAVGFEKNASLIFADAADRLEKLNAALTAGGQAIGLIGVTWKGKTLTVFSRLFREYEGEEWAGKFLADLSDSCGQKLSRWSGTKSITQLLN